MDTLAAVRRYFDAWNARSADAILASLAEGGTYQDPGTGGPISGEAIRAYVTGLWSAFPDLSFEDAGLAPTGPASAAAQWIMRGTNTGSMRGLPPTGKTVELHGADFFTLRDGKVATVAGYFDTSALPRQLGLNVIVQPFAVGPFSFGTSTSVQTGKTQEPGAFSITYLEASDADAVQKVREGSRASLIDMLKIDGFIGATTAVIGNRMVTISAWDSPDDSRKVMREGKHAEVQRLMFDGAIARRGYTSVWTEHHINPWFERCDSCGRMNRGAGADRLCSCGAKLPDPAPYW
jgi:steroid delta-isomerase-like uncharacterized protein